MLPIYHGLHHSNYSNSVHRHITRVLCEANPREALRLLYDRYSNKYGKPGHNIAKDRRMEFLIGIIKMLIKNKGSNIEPETVQQIKKCVDIKEELYIHTRLSHGVDLRTGRHKARSDSKDFELLMDSLWENKAHLKINGRTFGAYKYPENILDDEKLLFPSIPYPSTIEPMPTCRIA